MIGERDIVEDEPVIVGIEGAPTPIRSLHAEKPGEAPVDRAPPALGLDSLDPVESHQDHGRVVEVGIEVIVVLKRPAARGHVRALDLPVARHRDLLVDHPLGRQLELWVIGGQPRVDERIHGDRGVPDGRDAGLVMQQRGGLDPERLDFLDLAPDQRVIFGIAERLQREDGIGHGREDPAEAAGHGEPLLEPPPRRLHRASAKGPRPEALPALEAIVHADEEVLPEEGLGREGARNPGKSEARALAGHQPQLVEPAGFRQEHHGLGVHQDEERNDDRARPVRHLEQVEVRPAGQEHDLDGHRRDARPVVLAEEREQDLREDVGLGGTARRADPGAGRRHRGVVDRHAGDLHGEIGLDGCRQVGGALVVDAEAAVGKLLAAQVRDDLPLALAVDPPREMAEEEVLAGDGGIGLELSDPVPVGTLGSEERSLCPLDGGVNRGDHGVDEVMMYRQSSWKNIARYYHGGVMSVPPPFLKKPCWSNRMPASQPSDAALARPLAPLLLGTLLLRPYVFAFLAVFAWAGNARSRRAAHAGLSGLGLRGGLRGRVRLDAGGRSLRPVSLHGRDAGDRALSQQCAVLRLTVVSVPRLCLLLPRAEGPRAGRSRADHPARRGRHDAARRRDRPPRGPRRSMVSRPDLLLRRRRAFTSACPCRISRAGSSSDG